MRIVCSEKPAWLAAGLWFMLLGLIALLLLPALARGQSAGLSGVPPTSLPGESEVGRGHLSPPGLRSAAPGPENPGRHPARSPVASRPASGFHQNLAVLPASSGWVPGQCPLPPTSVFSLQTNLRQYLETWPTPGFTTTEAWPEYVPEDGEDVD